MSGLKQSEFETMKKSAPIPSHKFIQLASKIAEEYIEESLHVSISLAAFFMTMNSIEP